MTTTTSKKLLTTEYDDEFKYLQGFGNSFATEAIKGALPHAQNTPQMCNYGLYAEQLNGTAFTAPRSSNQKVWYYRIYPSVRHHPFEEYKSPAYDPSKIVASFEKNVTPQQLRWKPLELSAEEAKKEVDFVDGLVTIGGSGGAQTKTGYSVNMYVCNASMKNKSLLNADGDFLIVPQQGTLVIKTENGRLLVRPQEICVIPRGIKFSIDIRLGSGETFARGYVAEVYQGHFIIPDLGPIGANGLANPRDFSYPTAYYEDIEGDFRLIHKFQGKLFEAKMEHSPFDVVAWHGNYSPYKYNLNNFNVVNTVSFDHLDPSIFTVITCQTAEYGTAVMDFVIFPPRWGVAEHTFRPPYYHRNTMNEYMGLINGVYEAKEDGFLPGGGSLHSCMTAHGPEVQVFEKHSKVELKPERVAENSLAFMFESVLMMNPTDYAMQKMNLDNNYHKCWQGFKKNFKPPTLQ